MAATMASCTASRQLLQLQHSAFLAEKRPSTVPAQAFKCWRTSRPLCSSRSLASNRGPLHTSSALPRASLLPPLHTSSTLSWAPLLPPQDDSCCSKRPTVTTAAASASLAGDPFDAPQADEATDASSGTPEIPKGGVVDNIRAVLFYLTTLVIAIPLFVVMLVVHPFVLLFDPIRRRAQHFVNNIWANTTTSLFYKTEIVGAENLPAPDDAAVYVANHQSQLDIYTLFQLERPFKFISKTSNFLIPIVGWSMYLTGHVPLLRADKRSQMECLKKCLNLLQVGVPVLFFPEGTRSKDGKMASFKKGAFSIAAKAGAPVVPLTLLGTGTLMPNGQEGTLFGSDMLNRVFGVRTVRVVVHPPLVDKDADVLCSKAREVIAETLIANGLEVSNS